MLQMFCLVAQKISIIKQFEIISVVNKLDEYHELLGE